MAGNNAPQFVKGSNNQSVNVTAANTKSDGAGTVATDIFLLFTPGADGSFVEFIRIMPWASAAATATTATVARIFRSTLNTGTTSSANTKLLGEVTLPAQTADHSTNPVTPIDFPINERFTSAEYILVTTHAAPATNTGQCFTAFAGDF